MEIILQVNKQVVSSVKFLQLTDQYFIMSLVQNIEEFYYAPNEIITPYQAWVDEIFIVSKGIMSLYTNNGRLIKEYSSNSYFGALFMLNPQECPIIITSQTYSNIRTIDKEHLDESLDAYPRYKTEIFNELEKDANIEQTMISRATLLETTRIFSAKNNNTKKMNPIQNKIEVSSSAPKNLSVYNIIIKYCFK